MLRGRLCLVQASQGTVVALVQAVVADDWHPHLFRGLQSDPQRFDGSLEY